MSEYTYIYIYNSNFFPSFSLHWISIEHIYSLSCTSECVCACVYARTVLIRFAQLPIKINLFIFPYRIFPASQQKQPFLMMFVSTDNTTHNTNTYRYIRLYGANYNLFRLVLYNRLWTSQRQHRRQWQQQQQQQRQKCLYVRAFIVEMLSAECFRLPFLTWNKCIHSVCEYLHMYWVFVLSTLILFRSERDFLH